MKSLRIESKQRFDSLFFPTFKFLENHHWFISPDGFNFPLEWDDLCGYDPIKDKYTKGPATDLKNDFQYIYKGDSEGAHTAYGYYSHSNIFPKYAAAINDDWNEIFAVSSLQVTPIEWYRNRYKNGDIYVQSEVETSFISVDGAFWQFSTKNEKLINELVSHLSELEDVNYTHVDFCLY